MDDLPRMTCKELIDVLSDYLSNELSPDARADLETHLSVCPPCQRYLDSFKKTIAMGRMLQEDDCHSMPEELVQAILKARSGESAGKPGG